MNGNEHTGHTPILPTSVKFTSFQTALYLGGSFGSTPLLVSEMQRLKGGPQHRQGTTSLLGSPRFQANGTPLRYKAMIFSYCYHLLKILPEALLKRNNKKTKTENKMPFILSRDTVLLGTPLPINLPFTMHSFSVWASRVGREG